MSSTYACILHSSNGYYTEELTGNALQCLNAVQRSLRATAPDFILSIAVFFADPYKGTRCVYSSAVPDRNHALDRVAATYPTLKDVAGTPFVLEHYDGATSTDKATAYAQLFRLRSPLFLQQAVLRAAQEQNASVPTSAAEVTRKGFASRPFADASPSTVVASDDVDMWGCLAGGLLASLCYLRAHPSSATTSAGIEERTEAVDGAPAKEGAPSVATRLTRSAGKVLVFSDALAATVPSYSAECALSMAAVTASKMGVVVSCFGKAVAQHDVTGNRLAGLAASVGGFCAPRFAFPDLGQLLDGANVLADGGGSKPRQKRDRITSQYVVGPTMLPRASPPPASSSASKLSFSAVKREKKEEGDEERAAVPAQCDRASHLGWLCPSCMAIIYRGPLETVSSAASPSSDSANQRGDDGDVEQVMGPKCPYCSKA